MDCLTTTSCMTSILESLNQMTAAVDYFGLVLFGDGWSPIGPAIGEQAEALARVFGDVLLQRPSGCALYAMQGTAHA